LESLQTRAAPSDKLGLLSALQGCWILTLTVNSWLFTVIWPRPGCGWGDGQGWYMDRAWLREVVQLRRRLRSRKLWI